MTKHYLKNGFTTRGGASHAMPLERKDDGDPIVKEIKRFGDDIKGLRTSMEKDLATVRQIAEEAKKTSPELEAKLTEITDSIKSKEEAITAITKEQKEKIEALETAFNRLPALGEEKSDDVIEAAVRFFETKQAASGNLNWRGRPTAENADLDGYKAWEQHFGSYLRVDDRSMNSAEEVKALSVGSNPNGGYLIPTARSARIIERIFETSPLRALATVETIGTEALEIPIDRDEVDAGWVGEEEERSETSTPGVGIQRIPVHEMYAKPKMTQTFIEDASVDVEAWLERKVADKFGRKEATAFITGNGIKQPRGILTYPGGSAGLRNTILRLKSGAATAITSDGVVAMPYQLKGAYMANGSWMMRRTSILAVMLLKDNDGQYLWRPGLTAGAPSSLIGYSVSQADDMPNIAAGSLSLGFGDWRSAYTVVDRLGITTLRDPYSAKPFIEYYTRKRVGGDVTDFDAYVLMETGI